MRWLAVRQLRKALRAALDRVATPGGTVVDLGCGERPYQHWFEQAGMKYVGCDLEPPADVLLTPGEPVPLSSGCAAVVLSVQVLEHVADVDGYLSECRRLLATDGKLLLSTHGVWPYHPHPGDYHRWTRQGLVLVLERNGFECQRVTPLLGPLTWSLMIQGMAAEAVCAKLRLPAAALAPVNLALNGSMLLLDRLTPHAITRDNASIYVVEARAASARKT